MAELVGEACKRIVAVLTQLVGVELRGLARAGHPHTDHPRLVVGQDRSAELARALSLALLVARATANAIAENEQHAIELRQLIERSKSEITSAENKLREHETEIAAANALVEQTAQSLQQQKLELEQLGAAAAEFRRARSDAEEKIRTLQPTLSKDEVRLAASFASMARNCSQLT